MIQVSQSVVEALQGLYQFEPVTDVDMKGKGKLAVWELTALDSLTVGVGVEEG